jgi:RNA polymerase sigma-54 factor
VGRGPAVRLELGARGELRAVPGLLLSLRLLPLGYDALSGTVERALNDNPMLERASGSPCPGCGRHRTSNSCPRCSGVLRYTGQDPAVMPFDTLESAAACEIRSDCRAVLPVVIAHLTRRGLLDAEPDQIAGELARLGRRHQAQVGVRRADRARDGLGACTWAKVEHPRHRIPREEPR